MLDWLTGKKQAKTEEPKTVLEAATLKLSRAEFPDICRHSDVLQTLAFTDVVVSETVVVWMEAYQNAEDQTWFSRTFIQNADDYQSGANGTVESEKVVAGHTYESILAAFGSFEANALESARVQVGPSPDELADEYFKTAAHYDRIAFDVSGKPHPTLNGHIVSEGTFSVAERRAVLDVSEKTFPVFKLDGRNRLARIFESASQISRPKTINQLSVFKNQVPDYESMSGVKHDLDVLCENLKDMHTKTELLVLWANEMRDSEQTLMGFKNMSEAAASVIKSAQIKSEDGVRSRVDNATFSKQDQEAILYDADQCTAIGLIAYARMLYKSSANNLDRHEEILKDTLKLLATTIKRFTIDPSAYMIALQIVQSDDDIVLPESLGGFLSRAEEIQAGIGSQLEGLLHDQHHHNHRGQSRTPTFPEPKSKLF